MGQSSQWTAESQATARALATVIASRIRRVEDTREIAERRAVTDALINAAPDAVVIADGARRIVAFNQAAEELHGRRSAEALGQRLDEVLIPERNRAAFLEATTEFLRTQDPGEFAARMRLPVLRADGTERTVELTRLPLVVGGQTYFCSFARDVTELERANVALAASEARVRLLSELAPVGIARADDTGTCAYVNERWCALNGQLAGDVLGTSWLEAVHPGDVVRVRGEWARARAAGSELRTDFRLLRHAGEPLWVHAAVTTLPDQVHLPRGFMVALTNVTARPRVRARVDSGVSVAGRTVHDPELEQLGATMASVTGLTYISNVQARRDVAGRPALLEVNPRAPGALPLTMSSGVNMPWLALDALRGLPVPEHMDFHEMAMVRFLEERFMDVSEVQKVAACATIGRYQRVHGILDGAFTGAAP